SYDVVDIGKRLLPALLDNPLGQLAADSLHLGEPQPDSEVAITAMLQRAIGSRPYEGPYLELHALQAILQACRAFALGIDLFEIGVDVGLHDVGTQNRYAVSARICDQRLRGVEAHRLRSQQPRQKRPRIVQLEPRGGIDQQRKADGVALG